MSGGWMYSEFSLPREILQTGFEHVDRYTTLPIPQFAYSVLTRSQRISHENLRLRDANYVSSIEQALADGAQTTRRPPMFLPFQLRKMQLTNRVVRRSRWPLQRRERPSK